MARRTLFCGSMFLLKHSRFLLVASLLACLVSCKTPAEREKAEKKAEEQAREVDAVKDPSFKAFVGRLRKAVANKDVRTMSTMMTEDFGYSWEEGSDGYGCFKYWDDNNLWPELQRVVNTQFLPNGDYFTAPPEFVSDPNYAGFRAGIKSGKGTYKFAYFVPSQETPMAQPPMPGN